MNINPKHAQAHTRTHSQTKNNGFSYLTNKIARKLHTHTKTLRFFSLASTVDSLISARTLTHPFHQQFDSTYFRRARKSKHRHARTLYQLNRLRCDFNASSSLPPLTLSFSLSPTQMKIEHYFNTFCFCKCFHLEIDLMLSIVFRRLFCRFFFFLCCYLTCRPMQSVGAPIHKRASS